ncbi:MAG: DNA-directed RNA polymerase subunit H [Candidatus Diapherotrites archaeon]|uniref:DNA-directed RNA polymerase subunit Rpo5 n=1 Tax=Candidatus Iainarchaeum sp. TaxID=3101447 RepID=A0A8T3YJ43_9ARCH|nr:DNA-directed RNA polymerase subunit H [Candidatus Diapherotrites archaeon]
MDRVAQHFLVPKHEIVPDERAKEVFAKFGSTNDQFPQILSDDPAIVEIGAKRGDLIKVTRNSPTAGKSVFYRVVM